jgi:hypothetical protein
MDDMSGVVRSIRVGAALNDRFGELLSKKNYLSDEDLSSTLGEVRQLYPEIWSNLDDARNALAARGVPVEAYDSLRSSAAARGGGVLDVDLTENVLGRGGSKTAYFNGPGHTAAKQACDALRATLPDVDWVALDRAEAAEIAQFGSLGPARWKKVVFYGIALVLIAVAVGLYLVFRLTARGADI